MIVVLYRRLRGELELANFYGPFDSFIAAYNWITVKSNYGWPGTFSVHPIRSPDVADDVVPITEA